MGREVMEFLFNCWMTALGLLALGVISGFLLLTWALVFAVWKAAREGRM
jgi:hypothetical protein